MRNLKMFKVQEVYNKSNVYFIKAVSMKKVYTEINKLECQVAKYMVTEQMDVGQKASVI